VDIDLTRGGTEDYFLSNIDTLLATYIPQGTANPVEGQRAAKAARLCRRLLSGDSLFPTKHLIAEGQIFVFPQILPDGGQASTW
jgi:hypothetical protein